MGHCRDKLPVLEAVTLTLKDLVAEGDRLAQEQDFVMKHKLSEVCIVRMTANSTAKQWGMVATQTDFAERRPFLSDASSLLALRG